MLETLRIQNFKSWQDTGTIEFGALTGFFGTNSSGKTSILQFLLMLKQTVESSDRARILELGDDDSYVDLGILPDIIHNHANPGTIDFALSWQATVDYRNSAQPDPTDEEAISSVALQSSISYHNDRITLEKFLYHFGRQQVGAVRLGTIFGHKERDYYGLARTDAFAQPSVSNEFVDPLKFYGFSSSLYHGTAEGTLFQDLVFDFETQCRSVYYLGPLRDNPQRRYAWGGGKVQGVGNRGQDVIAALLAARSEGQTVFNGDDQPRQTLEECVAAWLHKLGLIEQFEVRAIAASLYEVRVKRTAESAEVFLTDVGFGISQLLPVLVLLFYVPEGSTIILEQPEIHLHPSAQAGLADVILDAIKRRKVQVILESHSEHLLQRLQRRMAENEVISADKVKLYFTKFEKAASEIEELKLDEYGNILNWPANFFGNPFAEASAMMDAELDRKEQAGKS